MALQSSLVIVSFLLLVGAAILSTSESDSYQLPPPKIRVQQFPISKYDYGQVQSIGKLAVDHYNMEGGPHLYFLQVVNGTVYEVPYLRTWNIDIKAINCTQSGTPDLYVAWVAESPRLVFGPLMKKMK